MGLSARIYEFGGPEVLQIEDLEVGSPAPHEVRLKQTAIGLNFLDTYQRSGLYPIDLPGIPGKEAAAVVDEVGESVTDLKVGDRVVYASDPLGAYAAERLMPADRVIKLPDEISDQQAAAMMVKGMTAEYLLRRTYPVKEGDVILVHAAAGGVGTIMCQWASSLGAVVIGTAGSDEKVALAKKNGCQHVINYNQDSFKDAVQEITKGEGVHAVYDSVGAATFMDSLDCLRVRGMMVTFGNASGPVPDFQPLILSQKGSLFLTRPSLWHYTATREDYVESAKALFDVVQKGIVKIAVNQTYPLSQAAQAHKDLEARKTTGSTILLPD